MVRLNEVEELIRLINKGFDLELLSIELEISMENLQEYKKRLELRKFAKESIKSGKISEATDRLNKFIESTDCNLIERVILLKLNAYANRTTVSEEDLQKIEEERKKIGFSRNIDEVLEELKVQIPKRKSSNMRKKEQQKIKEQVIEEETVKEVEEQFIKPDYEKTIKRYKAEIASNPQKKQGKRNLLAFAYFKAGRIDEAREQLISIAREEKDEQEIIRQLKDIISMDPENKKSKKRLRSIMNKDER